MKSVDLSLTDLVYLLETLNQVKMQERQSTTLLKLKEKCLILIKQAVKAVVNSSKPIQSGKLFKFRFSPFFVQAS